MLEDHFSEGEILTTLPNVPVLTLHNISYEVFICLLYYIYGDDTEVGSLTWQHTACICIHLTYLKTLS